jgi:hypothetical protein
MGGLIRLIVKGFFYIVVIIPVIRGIVSSFIPWGWLGWLLGLIVAAGVAIWLETSGLSNKILASIFNPNKSVKDTIGEGVGSLFESEGSSPKGPETTMTCPNCGTSVTLYGGHGKCEACDSAF